MEKLESGIRKRNQTNKWMIQVVEVWLRSIRLLPCLCIPCKIGALLRKGTSIKTIIVIIKESGIRNPEFGIRNPQSGTATGVNWETLKAVPWWNLSGYKIASAFEILSGHCQTGKLAWKKKVTAGRATEYMGTATNQNLTAFVNRCYFSDSCQGCVFHYVL